MLLLLVSALINDWGHIYWKSFIAAGFHGAAKIHPYDDINIIILRSKNEFPSPWDEIIKYNRQIIDCWLYKVGSGNTLREALLSNPECGLG